MAEEGMRIVGPGCCRAKGENEPVGWQGVQGALSTTAAAKMLRSGVVQPGFMQQPPHQHASVPMRMHGARQRSTTAALVCLLGFLHAHLMVVQQKTVQQPFISPAALLCSPAPHQRTAPAMRGSRRASCSCAQCGGPVPAAG